MPWVGTLGFPALLWRDWDMSSSSIHPGYWGWPCSKAEVMEGLPSSGFPTSFQSIVHWGCNNRWVVLSLSAGACETSNLLIILEALRWTAGTWLWAGQLWEKAAHSHCWACISAPGGDTCGRELLCPHMAASAPVLPSGKGRGLKEKWFSCRETEGHSLRDKKRP